MVKESLCLDTTPLWRMWLASNTLLLLGEADSLSHFGLLSFFRLCVLVSSFCIYLCIWHARGFLFLVTHTTNINLFVYDSSQLGFGLLAVIFVIVSLKDCTKAPFERHGDLHYINRSPLFDGDYAAKDQGHWAYYALYRLCYWLNWLHCCRCWWWLLFFFVGPRRMRCR